MAKTGIDVSHWQYAPGEAGAINYEVAKAAGIDFVVARTTNGKDKDKRFQRHFDGALAAGLVAAGYHYFRPRYGVQNQMDSILENLDGRKLAFYVLDVETSDDRGAPEVRQDVWDMLMLLEENLDCPIVIYTAEWYWGDKIRDKIMLADYTNQPKPRANYWPLWVADYGLNNGMPLGRDPILPRGWREGEAGDGPYKNQHEIVQYTSRLVLPGVGGSSTLDGDEMQDRFWALITDEPEPDPEPTPIPVPTEPGTIFVFEGTGTLVN